MSDIFSGDWDDFLNLTNVPIVQKMGSSLERSGEIVRTQIVKNIRDQKIEGPDLKPSTLKRKKGSQKLIEKGDYLSSFAVEKINDERIDIGSNHPQARRLELGYEPASQPARPHVGPAFGDAVPDVIDELGSALGKVLKK